MGVAPVCWANLRTALVPYGLAEITQTWLTEGLLNLICEGTRCEAASNGSSTSMLGKFEDSSCSIGSSRNNTDISRVLNSSNNSGSKNNLLPSFLQVDYMDTITFTFVHIALHAHFNILWT